MIFVVLFNIILYLLVVVWTYKNMYELEFKSKIIFIVGTAIVIYILTGILYNIGENPIGKELGEAANTFNKTIIIIFAGINCLITMPHIGIALSKYKEESIDINQLKKRLIIISIIFIIFMLFEFNYMKEIQTNMFAMIEQNNSYIK